MVDWEDFYRAFRAPDFIPGYELQNHLGGGAFGEVYKARKSSIGKAYAIKFLRLDEAANRGAIERELEQVRLFASIDHPNLVTIEDMGVVMDVPYLVMGYAGEETLGRRIERADLDPESALRYFVQACRGVLALHDRRLAHFDLKPSNVFLKGDVARVGDYGLARLLIEGRQTLSMGRGTPHYMAPEMLRNRADHRADLYSLGVILYESLTGRLPFGERGSGGMIVRESDQPPAFPPGFPARVAPVVTRALRLEPADRYASVHELLADLGQTARQGESVLLGGELAARAGEAGAAGPAAPPATPERANGAARNGAAVASSSGELRQAAAELARGAALVARGVWEGVRGSVGAGEGTGTGSPGSTGSTGSTGTPGSTGHARPAPGPALGDDVVSLQTLAEQEEERAMGGPTIGRGAAGATPVGGGGGGERGTPAPTAFHLRAPYGPGPAGGTVPVPPRAEGGLAGTLAASAVLGAEILGAVVTGPVLVAARGVATLADRLLEGATGALGGLLRTGLYLLALALFGALSALVVLSAIALGS